MCNDMKTCLFAAYKNMIIDSHASFSFSEKKQEVPANILYVDQYPNEKKKKLSRFKPFCMNLSGGEG